MSQAMSFLSPKIREIRAKFIVTGFNASHGFMKPLVSKMCKELKAPNVTPEFEVLARDMFVETHQLDIEQFNAILESLCLSQTCSDSAFTFFMKQKGDFRMVSPRTYEAMFNCCEKNRFHSLGNLIHGKTVELGLFKDRQVFDSLFSFYNRLDYDIASQLALEKIVKFSKERKVGSAREVFDKLFVKDMDIWESMVDGYVGARKYDEVKLLFHSMLNDKLIPNFNLVKHYIKACKETRECIVEPQILHAYCIRVSNGELTLQDKNILLSYYMIDPLYADGAREFFNNIDGRDLVTWNTLLNAIAVQGQFDRCLTTFQKIIEQGLSPDDVTFLGLLVACHHTGNIESARYYFERMESVYGVAPNVRHYNSMVSLIGRFSGAKEAYCFINEKMTVVKPNKIVWMTLVACCGMQGDFELGEYICKEKLPGGEGDKQLHHMYASAQQYDKAAEVRKRIEQSENKKLRRAAFSKLVD